MTTAGAAARLARAGSGTPRLDAELLLAAALGVDRAHVVAAGREELAPEALARFEELVGRREAGEPVAYILGYKDFRRISVSVDRRVLVPRPETELLVEVGLELAPGTAVLDVGTGSGAVALALKDERPDLVVAGSDIDPAAVAVAVANATRLELDVSFFVADLLASVPDRFDGVLANLPYVAEGSPEVAPEVVRHEPAAALFAGPDGLAVIRRLVEMASDVRILALEVGFDQASRVSELLAAHGFDSVECLRDLAGHERVVVGRR